MRNASQKAQQIPLCMENWTEHSRRYCNVVCNCHFLFGGFFSDEDKAKWCVEDCVNGWRIFGEVG